MDEAQTTLIVDGHIHLYPAYRPGLALRRLVDNLRELAGPPSASVAIGLLAESARCRFYDEICRRRAGLQADGMTVTMGPEDGSLVVARDGLPAGFLVAGRQIVTRERLEVLALTLDHTIPDGQPLREVVAAVRSAGGVPVLSWSPGKWFAARGRIVADLLASSPPDSFLIGDTGLRPTCWPLPELMQTADRLGFRRIAGSDPLPFAGEEAWLGTYGFKTRAPFDADRPVSSIRRLFTDRSIPLATVGRRVGPVSFVKRWVRNQVTR